MKYFKKLVGDNIYLSPIDLSDVNRYTEWINDLELTINLGLSSQLITREKEKELLEEMSKDYVFAIVTLERDELLGNCGLHNIDLINKTAELGIFIGEKKNWNKGFGSEATMLLLAYGFNILNLNNVMLTVKEHNKRAIACYKRCGFKHIGMRREANIYGNKKYGTLYMDILAAEFPADICLNLDQYL